MLSRYLLPLIFFLLFQHSFTPVHAQSFITKEGHAEFISNAPMLEFKGTSKHLNGLINLDKNLVDFYLDLNTLDTGIQLRNKHMRDSYLQTEQYPFAEFTGKLVSSFDPQTSKKQQVRVKGTFQVHGVERKVEITGSLTPVGDKLALEASWTISLEDYQIERPGVVFYELADEQKINISAQLEPRENFGTR